MAKQDVYLPNDPQSVLLDALRKHVQRVERQGAARAALAAATKAANASWEEVERAFAVADAMASDPGAEG